MPVGKHFAYNIAFRARNVSGTFEKHTPGLKTVTTGMENGVVWSDWGSGFEERVAHFPKKFQAEDALPPGRFVFSRSGRAPGMIVYFRLIVPTTRILSSKLNHSHVHLQTMKIVYVTFVRQSLTVRFGVNVSLSKWDSRKRGFPAMIWWCWYKEDQINIPAQYFLKHSFTYQEGLNEESQNEEKTNNKQIKSWPQRLELTVIHRRGVFQSFLHCCPVSFSNGLDGWPGYSWLVWFGHNFPCFCLLNSFHSIDHRSHWSEVFFFKLVLGSAMVVNIDGVCQDKFLRSAFP